MDRGNERHPCRPEAKVRLERLRACKGRVFIEGEGVIQGAGGGVGGGSGAGGDRG